MTEGGADRRFGAACGLRRHRAFHRNRTEHLVEIGKPVGKRGWQARAYHFIPDTYTDNNGDMRVPATRCLRATAHARAG